MMEITSIDDTTDSSGGAELSNFDVLTRLSEKGHRIRVLARSRGDLVSEYQKRGIEVSIVPKTAVRTRSAAIFSDLFQFSHGLLSAARIHTGGLGNVVYCNDWQSIPFAYALSRFIGAPYVQHIRVNLGCLSRQFRIPLRKANLIIGNSDHVCKTLHRIIGGGNIKRIYNGIDLSRYRGYFYRDQNPIRILYAGRITPNKGLHVLASAMPIVCRSFPHCELLIAGPLAKGFEDYFSRITSLLNQEGISFNYLGHKTEMRDVYAQACVVVVPSICQEAFGRVIVEAMASGLPVVASRIGGMPEVFGEEFAGFMVKENCVEELAAGILRALNSVDENGVLARSLRARAESFSIEATVNSIETDLTEVSNSHAQNRTPSQFKQGKLDDYGGPKRKGV